MDDRFIRSKSKWMQPGTFNTQSLRDRIVELLPIVKDQADNDFNNGRLRFRDLDELVEAVDELVRLSGNTERAFRPPFDDTPQVSER